MHTTKLPSFSIRVTEVCILGSVTYTRLSVNIIYTNMKTDDGIYLKHQFNISSFILLRILSVYHKNCFMKLLLTVYFTIIILFPPFPNYYL